LIEQIPDGWERLFLCGRDRRVLIDRLLGEGYTVLVPPFGAQDGELLDQALALSKGDPIVYIAPSSNGSTSIDELAGPLQDGLADAVIGGEVQNGVDPESGPCGPQCIALSRRTFDSVGSVGTQGADGDLVAYEARLRAADARVHRLGSGEAEDGPMPAPTKLGAAGDELRVPIYQGRRVFRDHIRRAPIELLSVVMVTHNRLDYLDETWRRLLEVTPEARGDACQFVFVDNASDAAMRDWLLDREAWVLFNPANTGIAPARNQALALANGDPIVMIDPDLLLPEGWFDKALDVLTLPGIGFTSVSAEDCTYQILDICGVEVELKQGNIAGVWVIPRQTIELLGYFNEEYSFYGGEDSDYGARIMLAGMMNTYIPHMKADHLGAADGVYSSQRTDYVEMKAKWWDVNMALYERRANEYARGERSLRIERAQYAD